MDTFRLIDLLLLLTPTVILIPFLFQGLSPQGEYPFRLFPLVSLPAFGLLYVAPETYSLKISWLLIEMQWGVNHTTRLFLFFTMILWLVSGLCARELFKKPENETSFMLFFLLAMSGNIGLILSQDIISFYMFFALMSFSSFGLIVFNRDREAFFAGKVYIYLVVLSETILFIAFALLYANSGQLEISRLQEEMVGMPDRHLIISLLILGFGVKVGILPLHVWLPLAHPAAPIPASAVLSGVMIKAGLLGWIQLLPLGAMVSSFWGGVLLSLGIFGALYAAIIGLFQNNPKVVLAYSSISQMGIVTAGIGMAFFLPGLWNTLLLAILAFALHHSLAKGSLFLSLGVIRIGKNQVRLGYLKMVVFFIPVLSIIGFPYTSGMFAKSLLKSQVQALPAVWQPLMNLFFPLSMSATALIIMRFVYLAIPRFLREEESLPSRKGFLYWLALVFLSSFSIWFYFAELIVRVWQHAAIFSSILIFVVTLFVSWSMFAIRKKGIGIKVLTIPPGDLLVVMMLFIKIVKEIINHVINVMTQWHPYRLTSDFRQYISQFHLREKVIYLEKQNQRWSVVSTIFVIFCTIFIFLILI